MRSLHEILVDKPWGDSYSGIRLLLANETYLSAIKPLRDGNYIFFLPEFINEGLDVQHT